MHQNDARNMIYLVDSSRFKIIFDKSQFDKALALPLEAQEKLKEQQLLVLTGQAKGKEIDIAGHPFQLSETQINGKKAYEPAMDKTENILLSDVEWKVIKTEDQESDIKYVEII